MDSNLTPAYLAQRRKRLEREAKQLERTILHDREKHAKAMSRSPESYQRGEQDRKRCITLTANNLRRAEKRLEVVKAELEGRLVPVLRRKSNDEHIKLMTPEEAAADRATQLGTESLETI